MNKRVPLAELSPLMTEALQKGAEVVLTVTGASMLPMLRHRRDKVRLVKPEGERLKKYDIPLFARPDGTYVLHRIVAVKRGGYAVAGDNRRVKEYPVRHSQVLGVVKGFWRDGTYISCADFRYRLYCRLWFFLYPVRRICFDLINLGRAFRLFRRGSRAG